VAPILPGLPFYLVTGKCYDVHAETRRAVDTKAEPPNWWTEHLRFQNPDGV